MNPFVRVWARDAKPFDGWSVMVQKWMREVIKELDEVTAERDALRALLTPPAAPDSPLQRAFDPMPRKRGVPISQGYTPPVPCGRDHESAESYRKRNERDRG